MTALRSVGVLCLSAFCLIASAPASVAGQAPAASATTSAATTLTIAGDVTTPLTLTAAELKTLPRTSVQVKDDDGKTTTYEGVLVGELLKRAGAPVGPALRGNAISTYIVAAAKDGYQAVFSIAELDPVFTGSRIMVADTSDGKPLFEYQGPFRIVCPSDTRGARSIRMLERINVVRLQK